MRDSRSSVIVLWLRAFGVVLLLIFGYTVTSGVVYVLWSRLIGWPVVSSALGEVLLRLVHLVPALACGAAAACVGGAINRIEKPLFPAAILASGIGLVHYASYSRPSRTSVDDIVAAAVESAILFGVALICLWVVACKRRQVGTH